MEHQNQHIPARLIGFIRLFAVLVLSSLVLNACKQPIENPELSDPIYNDLSNEIKAAEAAEKSETDAVAESRKSIAELPPRDPLKGQYGRQLASHLQKANYARQLREYFTVRRDQRKDHDLKVYPDRFDKDLPWPDMAEFDEYKKFKRLRSTSRNWDDRVPKFKRYSKDFKEGPPVSKDKPEH